MGTKLSSAEMLDREFLKVRSRILDIAASFDRIDEATGPTAGDDARIRQVRDALTQLMDDHPGRAERVQMIFSLPFEDDWRD
ncbi:MAG: hypothetical protein ACYTHJ_02295 [Planctomycetota bacterium]|jgi:hypothetical protein